MKLHQVTFCGPNFERKFPGEQAEIAGTQAEIPGIRSLHFQLEFTDGGPRVRTFFVEQVPFYSFRTFFLCKIGSSIFFFFFFFRRWEV